MHEMSWNYVIKSSKVKKELHLLNEENMSHQKYFPTNAAFSQNISLHNYKETIY